MTKTKILTNQEYDGLNFSLEEVIRKIANKESNKWWARREEERKLLPMKVKKNTHVRWDLFFLGVLKDNIMQLKP